MDPTTHVDREMLITLSYLRQSFGRIEGGYRSAQSTTARLADHYGVASKLALLLEYENTARTLRGYAGSVGMLCTGTRRELATRLADYYIQQQIHRNKLVC